MANAKEDLDYDAMLAAATCTEEMFVFEPPFGPQLPGVCMVPGSRTIQTTLNIMLFQHGNLPQLIDPDFVIPGPTLAGLLVRLGREEVTFQGVSAQKKTTPHA